jgi:hypothetical protein
VRDPYHRPVDRTLTTREAAPLRWLVDHGTPEAKEYADQVHRTRVVEGAISELEVYAILGEEGGFRISDLRMLLQHKLLRRLVLILLTPSSHIPNNPSA